MEKLALKKFTEEKIQNYFNHFLYKHYIFLCNSVQWTLM